MRNSDPRLRMLLLGGRRFSLPSYLSTVNGAYWDFTKLSALSQDTAGATPVASIGDPIGRAVDTINGKNATQATGTQKPTFQTSGGKFDGADDNLLTSYLAGAGSNFIVALVTVPASISGTQFVAGMINVGRFYIGFSSGGLLVGGVGNDGISTVVGSVDYRGQDIVCALTNDGSAVRLFGDVSLQYSGAQSGSVNTVTPFRIGAMNSAGTAANFFGGSIKRIAAGRDFLTLSRYQQIRSALLAG